MAKFMGKVGFAEYLETAPDVHQEVVTEKPYLCETKRSYQRYSSSAVGSTNDDVVMSNQIEIVCGNEYAFSHVSFIKYVTYKGVRWKVQSFEERFPRIVLNLGEVYNGPTPEVE